MREFEILTTLVQDPSISPSDGLPALHWIAVYAPNVLQQNASEGLIKFSYLTGLYEPRANQPSVRFTDCHEDRIPNAPGILLRKAASYSEPDNMWWEGVIQGTFRRMCR